MLAVHRLLSSVLIIVAVVRTTRPGVLNPLVLGVALSLLSPLSTAQTPAGIAPGADQRAESDSVGGRCMFDTEIGVVSGCIIRNSSGKLFIAPRYVRQLPFDASGLAPLWSDSQPQGWMYADRKGRVVVTGVAAADNWACSFHDGLVQVTRDGKLGFANRAGRLVIPAVYDAAMDFEKGTAVVCEQCKAECHGEHCWCTCSHWLRIDTQGRFVEQVKEDPN